MAQATKAQPRKTMARQLDEGSGDMSLTGSSNAEKIWNYLYSKIGNAYGVAGLMGNLYAESGLDPKNLQNSYNTKLGMTDAEYTAAVDDGSYAEFATDSAGYGLAQWTYGSRKKAMITYHQGKSKSIGDLETQLGFLTKEMSESYAAVYSALKSATSVKAASDKVLTGYEKPADQSTAVRIKRAKYGQAYYDKYAGASASSSSTPTYVVGKTYTLQYEINVRTGPGTSYAKVGYSGLTSDGKKHDSDKDGALDKGTSVTCKGTSKDSSGNVWMRIPSGYIAAYYNKKEYVS